MAIFANIWDINWRGKCWKIDFGIWLEPKRLKNERKRYLRRFCINFSLVNWIIILLWWWRFSYPFSIALEVSCKRECTCWYGLICVVFQVWTHHFAKYSISIDLRCELQAINVNCVIVIDVLAGGSYSSFSFIRVVPCHVKTSKLNFHRCITILRCASPNSISIVFETRYLLACSSLTYIFTGVFVLEHGMFNFVFSNIFLAEQNIRDVTIIRQTNG